MKSKQRKPLFWTVVVLCSVALIGLGISPSLAQNFDELLEALPEVDTKLGTGIDPEEVYDMELDGQFGGRAQITWVPASLFVPYDSTTTYMRNAQGDLYHIGGPGRFIAPIRLPSGALLGLAGLFGYDTSSYNVDFQIVRRRFNASSQTLGDCDKDSTGASGTFQLGCVPNTIIANAIFTYDIIVDLDTADSSQRFWGVALIWARQVRTGLPNPFDDIGGLPARFQNAIKALAASGITQGCDANSYCPSNNVTRGQMAVFLAEALGLHWDAEAGF